MQINGKFEYGYSTYLNIGEIHIFLCVTLIMCFLQQNALLFRKLKLKYLGMDCLNICNNLSIYQKKFLIKKQENEFKIIADMSKICIPNSDCSLSFIQNPNRHLRLSMTKHELLSFLLFICHLLHLRRWKFYPSSQLCQNLRKYLLTLLLSIPQTIYQEILWALKSKCVQILITSHLLQRYHSYTSH